MIQLKLNTSICGNNFAYARGDEVDWPDDADAVRLIEAGIAKPLGDEAKKAYEAAKKNAPPPRRPTPQPTGRPTPPPQTPPARDPRDNETPVGELDLDDTTIAKLIEAGLSTVGQVTANPDLSQISGIGKATATKILQAAASA